MNSEEPEVPEDSEKIAEFKGSEIGRHVLFPLSLRVLWFLWYL
jgi:hypothetical protein